MQPLRVAWFKIPLGIVTDSTRHSHQFHSLWLKNPGSSKFFVEGAALRATTKVHEIPILAESPKSM